MHFVELFIKYKSVTKIFQKSSWMQHKFHEPAPKIEFNSLHTSPGSSPRWSGNSAHHIYHIQRLKTAINGSQNVWWYLQYWMSRITGFPKNFTVYQIIWYMFVALFLFSYFLHLLTVYRYKTKFKRSNLIHNNI